MATVIDVASVLPWMFSNVGQAKGEEAMITMLAAIVSCTFLAVVAFAIGYLVGDVAGAERSKEAAHDKCLEFARLALHGALPWRSLTPAAALRLAGVEILRPGGSLSRKFDQRPPTNRVIREGATGGQRL